MKRKGLKKAIKISGETLYVYDDPARLPGLRMIAYLARADETGKATSAEMYDLFQKQIGDYAKAGDTQAIIILNDHMKTLRSMHSTIEACIRLADIFILLEDEPEDQPSHPHYIRKTELCERSPEALDFFLTISLPLVKSTRLLPKDLNLMDYLKETGRYQLEKRLIRLISGPAFKIFYPKSKVS